MLVGIITITLGAATYLGFRLMKRNFVSEANSILFQIDNRQTIFSYDEIVAKNQLILSLLEKAKAKITSLGISEKLFVETIQGAHERARDHLLNQLQNATSHRPEELSLELRKHLEMAPLPDEHGVSIQIADLVAQNHARAAWQLLVALRTARGLAQKTSLLNQILEHVRLAGQLDDSFARELQGLQQTIFEKTMDRNVWSNQIPVYGATFAKK